MAGTNLNLRPSHLVALIAAGLVSSQLIARYIPAGSIWLSWLFIAYASYGLIFAGKGILRGFRFIRADYSPHVSPDKVYVVANLRRELLRGEGHVMVFLIGVFSLDPPSWFGTFFTAAMFNLVYVMNANATLDDTLGGRMRQANRIQAARLAEEAAKELVKRDVKRDASRERTRVAKVKRDKKKS